MIGSGITRGPHPNFPSILAAVVFLSIVIIPISFMNVHAEYGIIAVTQESHFRPGEEITLIISVPVDSRIVVEVDDPYDEIILMESTTSEEGIATITFRLPDDAEEGKYLFYTNSVTLDLEDYATTSGSFMVEGDNGDGFDFIVPDPTTAFIATSIVLGAVVVTSQFHEPWRFILYSFFVPLYTRIRPQEMEESMVRAQLLGYLRHNPGANYTTMKRDLQFSNGKLTHHLKMLTNANRIKSINHGPHKLFYPRDFRIPGDVYALSHSHSLQRKIMDILSHNPGLNQKELVRILEKDRKTVSLHLNTLAEKGKIRIDRKGRENIYKVIDQGMNRYNQPITRDPDEVSKP